MAIQRVERSLAAILAADFAGYSRLMGADVEGQNLTIERYSGGGRPEGFPDLARGVAGHNPDAIVAITNPIALAAAQTPIQYRLFGSGLSQ